MTTITNCKNCSNPCKSDFCSDKCKNSYRVKIWVTNNKHPCPKCNNLILPKSKLCRKCRDKDRIENAPQKNMTLGEYQRDLKHNHPSWKNADARNFARTWNKSLKELPCQNCGYEKHVELCHIKPIKDFSLTTTLGEVNHPDNLLVLCPNCHWEFDNKVLSLKDIKQRK